MRKSKGLVSLEVILMAALGIIIVTALMERCINKKALINQLGENNSAEFRKDTEELEFLKEFVDVFKQAILDEKTEDFHDTTKEEIDKTNSENNEKQGQEINEEPREISIVKDILGKDGFLRNRMLLKYNDTSDEFILIEKISSWQRKCSYYRYEFIEGNLVLEKRRYYEYY